MKKPLERFILQTRVHRTEALAVVRKLIDLYGRGDTGVSFATTQLLVFP